MPSAKCGGFKDQEVGKFLVLRRDGTVPDWTWFVLGAADPYAPAALRAYANDIMLAYPGDSEREKEMFDYAQDVWRLSHQFDEERHRRAAETKKVADPEKGPHRPDDPYIIELMRAGGQIYAANLTATLARLRRVARRAALVADVAEGDDITPEESSNRVAEMVSAITALQPGDLDGESAKTTFVRDEP